MKWGGGYPHRGLVVRIHLELFAESPVIISQQSMWLLVFLRAARVSVPVCLSPCWARGRCGSEKLRPDLCL